MADVAPGLSVVALDQPLAVDRAANALMVTHSAAHGAFEQALAV
jgi:hypothetical protein